MFLDLWSKEIAQKALSGMLLLVLFLLFYFALFYIIDLN